MINTSIADTLSFSNKAPAGFEDLVAPQHTLLDIYYANKKIGESFATFSPTSFEFDNASEVIKNIPNILNKNTVIQALTGQLEMHSELVCRKPNEPAHCGLLMPPIAGIIFNEARFRVDVFIHKDLLEIIPLTHSRYLPELNESTGFTHLLNIGGTVGGINLQMPNYSLRTSHIMSYDLMRLRSVNTFNNQEGLQLQNLILEKDWQDFQLSAGMFWNTPSHLFGQKELLGVRFNSSLKMRTDLDNAYGSPLNVFLPRRAFVEVYRDNNLLSSVVYDAGNQSIDTRDFPDGAYELKLIISDPFGERHEETRFFSKSNTIPPLNEPLYFAEIGLLRNTHYANTLPSYQGNWLAQLLTTRRFIENFGGDASLLLSNKKDYIANIGLFFMHPFLNSRFRVGGLLSLQGDYGIELNAFSSVNNFSTNLDIRRLQRDSPNIFSQPFDILPISYTQANFAINYSLGKTNLAVQTRWQSSNNNGVEQNLFSITPIISRVLYSDNGFLLNLNAQYNLSNQDSILLATLSLSFQQLVTPNIMAYTTANSRYQNNATKAMDYFTNTGINWRDANVFESDIDGKLEFRRQQDNTIIYNQSNYRGSIGGASGYVQHTIPEKNTAAITNYGGSFNFNLLSQQQGLEIGGYGNNYSGSSNDSAVLIDIEGSPKNAAFDVLVARIGKKNYQEQRQANAFVGGVVVIPLAAYEAYSVRIKAHKDNFSRYDMNAKQVTLYPGNIFRLTWKAKQSFILLSTLVDNNDNAIVKASVKGALEPTVTDENGFFQAEVESESILTVNDLKGKSCHVNLNKNLVAIDGVVTLDKLICVSEDLNSDDKK